MWCGREDSLCPLVLSLSKDIKRKLYSEATKSKQNLLRWRMKERIIKVPYAYGHSYGARLTKSSARLTQVLFIKRNQRFNLHCYYH